MAQFDSLIIFPLVCSLFVSLICYYNFTIKITIPNFFGIKKFWQKKLSSVSFYQIFYSNNITNINNSYKTLFLSLKK